MYIEQIQPRGVKVLNEVSVADAPLDAPSGDSSNGSVTLDTENTWFAVPGTVPTTDYILIATLETAVGNVRFGYSNSGTPSATNGNLAPSQLTIRLAANQSIYYASDVADDVVNWTVKQA